MRLETRSSIPTSQSIIDWATLFALLLSLVILALSVGLIRSETAGDIRTLTATGASNRTRRSIAATTAGALGLAGGVLGIVAGYVGIGGWLQGSAVNGGIGALSNVPVTNLLTILIGMPLLAAAGAWLFSGRQPKAMNRQPLG